jgi:phosphatidylglycerophosphatase A
MSRLALLIATALGAGYSPIAPGTAGSAVGLAAFFLLRAAGGGSTADAVSIVALMAAGTWAAGVAERHFGREDPGPVVVDEVMGMLVSVAFLPLSPLGALVGFVVFRVFDVVKPWPANRLERLGGGLGIMADDLMAGVYSHLVVRTCVWFAPALMLAA